MVFLLFLNDIFILFKNELRLGNAIDIEFYSPDEDKESIGIDIFLPYF
jgi:hypothetical protein